MIESMTIEQLRREVDQAKHNATAPTAHVGSEIWLAEVFAKRVSGRLRWSPGLDYMRNEGTHWIRDDSLARFTEAKAMLARMSTEHDLTDKQRGALASAKTVGAVLTLARAEPGISTEAGEWDREPMVLNTPAGAFDLETGKTIGTRMLFTQVSGAAPDPSLPMPAWEKFIAEIFGGDLEMVEFMQRLIGYCLTGDRREQRLPFFFGSGANGKSVLVDLVMAMAGTYALNLPSEVLMRQRHQGHPTELAQLRGKRLAVSSELEDGAYWAESRIKSLTGDATLTARYMRGDFFTFPQTHKHVVVGNFKPRMRGDDPAIARRMLLVPFTETFTGSRCDPLLSARLAAEMPAILAWAIAGAAKWARDGLAVPARVRDATAEYLAAHDDLTLWIEDCCVVGGQHRAPARALYAAFTGWKDQAGERAQSQTAWGSRMGQRFQQYRTMSERGYVGIALKQGVSETYARASGREA